MTNNTHEAAQAEILAAFAAYDRLVRWEEHNSRLDATEPIIERGQARGHIVAVVTRLAAPTLAEEHRLLTVALTKLTDEWYGLWVSNHARFTPLQVEWAQRVEAEARAILDQIERRRAIENGEV